MREMMTNTRSTIIIHIFMIQDSSFHARLVRFQKSLSQRLTFREIGKTAVTVGGLPFLLIPAIAKEYHYFKFDRKS
jgi:hypothetical protein